MTKRGPAIVLIGFMGAGKSSTGIELERIFGLRRFDTDAIVAEKYRLSIPEIFASLGADGFRAEETTALRNLVPGENIVIVTGGGIILRDENLALLRQLGTIVLLEAREEVLFDRIGARTADRPLLQTSDPRAALQKLLCCRQPLYQSAADIRIDTSDRKADEVAHAILREVEIFRQRNEV